MSDAYHYQLMAKAIMYLIEHGISSPSLSKLAAEMNMSTYHFQRTFSKWVGVSPKKFVQYVTLKRAKHQILTTKESLAAVAHQVGFSGSSRLHDLFVKIERMTPDEYRQGGAGLTIHYRYLQSIFGEYLVAATSKGICHLSFCDEKDTAFRTLKLEFPNAELIEKDHAFFDPVLAFFDRKLADNPSFRIHLKGTDFQTKVWESLLKLPAGTTASYGLLAQMAGNPSASRAVGTAIGQNPIAFLIPCHRVIQASGIIGGYRWTPLRKQAILAWEAAYLDTTDDTSVQDKA